MPKARRRGLLPPVTAGASPVLRSLRFCDRQRQRTAIPGAWCCPGPVRPVRNTISGRHATFGPEVRRRQRKSSVISVACSSALPGSRTLPGQDCAAG